MTILKRLQQEGVHKVQAINLKIMMANVAAFQETLPAVLSSTYDEIVSQWMEDHKSRLSKEKSFQRLYFLAMKAKGCVDWFKPTTEGEAILCTARNYLLRDHSQMTPAKFLGFLTPSPPRELP